MGVRQYGDSMGWSGNRVGMVAHVGWDGIGTGTSRRVVRCRLGWAGIRWHGVEYGRMWWDVVGWDVVGWGEMGWGGMRVRRDEASLAENCDVIVVARGREDERHT